MNIEDLEKFVSEPTIRIKFTDEQLNEVWHKFANAAKERKQ